MKNFKQFVNEYLTDPYYDVVSELRRYFTITIDGQELPTMVNKTEKDWNEFLDEMESKRIKIKQLTKKQYDKFIKNFAKI